MGSGRRSLGWINRERVEGCIELSAHAVQTFVAEIERTIIVRGERNVRVGWHPGSRNGRRDTGPRIDGVQRPEGDNVYQHDSSTSRVGACSAYTPYALA